MSETMNRKTTITALVITALSLCGMMVTAQEGKGLWGVKPVPLETVLRKAQFQVLTPKAPVGQYTLQKAEIAWVSKYQDDHIHLPARHVICLFYKIQGKGVAAVVEAKVPKGDIRNSISIGGPNVYQAVGEGYFFDEQKVGTWLTRGRAHGTDFVILTAMKGDAQALKDALMAQANGGNR